MRLVFRDIETGEMGFVLQCWADSYRVAHAAGLIPMHMWWEVMMPALQWVCDRPGVRILVAADADNSDGLSDLYGFIVYEKDATRPERPDEQLTLVHYVYVKDKDRRQGIARRLLRAAEIRPKDPFYYTCKTGDSQRCVRKMPGAKWKPLIARFAKETTNHAQKN